MIFRKKKKEEILEKTFVTKTVYSLFLLLFFLFSNTITAQDSIPIAKDLTEEKELEFQQFFFKALSEKSIGNYQKAIENLENCNQILPENVSVYFEFSKNYLLLNQLLEAKQYVQRAITKQPENIWLLKHLVTILNKQRNLSEAIEIQKKIAAKNDREQAFLASLYIQNNDFDAAIAVIQEIEKKRTLSSNLKFFKAYYYRKKNKKKRGSISKNNLEELIEKFKTDKSYSILSKILSKVTDENQKLVYLNQGLQLFPAQPNLYLTKAKVLYANKQYKNSISVLQNGIDFVLENKMLKEFYKLLVKNNKALGNTIEENKYKQKLKKIKS